MNKLITYSYSELCKQKINIDIVVFWVMTLCSAVGGLQHVGQTCHLGSEAMLRIVRSHKQVTKNVIAETHKRLRSSSISCSPFLLAWTGLQQHPPHHNMKTACFSNILVSTYKTTMSQRT